MGIFEKFKIGLQKTASSFSSGLKEIIIKREIDDKTLDEIEEFLIQSDVGIIASEEIKKIIAEKKVDPNKNKLDEINSILRDYIISLMSPLEKSVFFSKKNLFKSFFYFALVNFLAIIQTYYISIWTKEIILLYIGINQFMELIAHSTGVIFPVFTSYFGHKYISFK